MDRRQAAWGGEDCPGPLSVSGASSQNAARTSFQRASAPFSEGVKDSWGEDRERGCGHRPRRRRRGGSGRRGAIARVGSWFAEALGEAEDGAGKGDQVFAAELVDGAGLRGQERRRGLARARTTPSRQRRGGGGERGDRHRHRRVGQGEGAGVNSRRSQARSAVPPRRRRARPGRRARSGREGGPLRPSRLTEAGQGSVRRAWFGGEIDAEASAGAVDEATPGRRADARTPTSGHRR